MRTRNSPLLLAPMLLAALALSAQAGAATLYLVRHAEKEDGADPGLTAAGAQRAADLALLLRDAGIRHVFSSDFRRTRATAAPLAAALGLEVRCYDPGDLAGLAEQLKELQDNALVVGHSDTTPALVRRLGGTAEPLPEWQYDRVYQLRLGTGDSIETTLLHLPPVSVNPVPEL